MRLFVHIALLLGAVLLFAVVPGMGDVQKTGGTSGVPDMCGPQNGGACVIADFIASPTVGDAPLRVQFLDASSGRPSMWSWDFGDGQTAKAIADPVHVYTSPGKYTVTLVASSLNGGSDTEEKIAYITVRDPTPIYADFVGHPTSGKAPLSVEFSDCTIGNPDTWLWEFGDGYTDTVENPTHVYQKPGKYTVTLTANTSLGGSSTNVKEDYIRVDPVCEIVSDFTFSPQSGIAPMKVQFTDTSSGSPTMWSWDFGDGSTDMVANPVHTFTKPGSYTVKLTASSQSCGSSNTKEAVVTVNSCTIKADFVAAPTSGSAPLTVQFTDKSTGNPTMWSWDFGDGVIPMESCSGDGCSNVANPVHTYAEPGTYTVTMTASSQYGCSDTVTKQQYVVVVPACTIKADFVAAPTSGSAPLTVQFTDKSTGNPTMWSWDFGDGVIPMESCSGDGCGNVASPVHTYAEPGTYTVTLTASNQYGCSDTVTKKEYVVVVPACTIKADFVAAPTSGSAPLTVQFTDKSTGNPTMWSWDFGDGVIPMESCSGDGCGNVASPVHTYLEPGTYTVTLTASNQYGCSDMVTKKEYVVVVPACTIKADFVAAPTSGSAPLTVQFTDKSTGNPTMWSWDFGDGVIPMEACSGDGCGNVASPVHTYLEPGTYTVTLTASNQYGCSDTVTKKEYVVVVPACEIKADFVAAPTSGSAPLTVQFTDKSTGNPTMWSWDFGDGVIPMEACSGDGCGNVASPVHTYLEPGTYTVTLTASNQYGCSDTVTKKEYVVVVPACAIKADFVATPTSGSAPLTVQFTDKSTGSPTMWSWDFGDGVIPMEACSGDGCGNVASPVHTYLEPGTYTVTLTASNQYGCSDTVTKKEYVVVVPACAINADFVATPTTGSSPLTVQFTDKSTGNPTMWNWDFGDGVIPMASCSGDGCGNVANPVHTYLEPGKYTVTLTASNQYGCSDTETKKEYIVVVPACTINTDFVAAPVSGDAPLKVQFTDKSTGGPTMWKWDFGDGVMPMTACSGSGCDDVASPYHTYLDPGTYTVTLTASNQMGCSDTEIKKDYITVGSKPPVDGTIPLSAGWNFVSVPKKLAPGSDTAAIFSHIDVKGHSVFQYDSTIRAWNMLSASSPIRPLDSFWIYSSKADSIPLTYDTNQGQTPTKQLKKGWNGIGFTGLTPLAAKGTLASVQDQWVNCAGFNAELQRYNQMIIKGSNDNTLLEPFKGYWLYVSADGLLVANA